MSCIQASGRPWKGPADRSGALKNPLLGTSWEKKMKLKAERNAFKTVKQESIAAHKEKLAVSRLFLSFLHQSLAAHLTDLTRAWIHKSL